MAGKGDYVCSTVPAKEVYVSSTTYFHLAAQNFNDALRWVDFAKLNHTFDPWLPGGPTKVLIPPVLSTTESGVVGM